MPATDFQPTNDQPLSFPPMPPTDDTLAALHGQLLDWFATAARDLPWRQTRDPYHILVAEMMLQQTQVDRVRPRYAAFLQAFPRLDDLAAASSADVIKQWSGLGYNRRAINLQRIARAVLEQYGGNFPASVAELLCLPGIGPYTAGALACFAFEQDVAFMDTNIRRVVRRLLVGPEDAAPPTSERELLQLAEVVIPAGRGWQWNQAIMELGALICTAATPSCWRCPLRQTCRAYAAWRQADEQIFTTVTGDGDGANTSDQPTPTAQSETPRRTSRRAEPFVGSNRYYRGRFVALLRQLPPHATLPLPQLGMQIKADYDAQRDTSWLHHLAEQLAHDGLIEVIGDHVRLPVG